MATSMLLGIFSWLGDFFRALIDLIPKIVYLLYASLACLLDCLQLFFRKLAGLDVYYVDGKAVSGDLVTNFITGILGINANNFSYSVLSTVFWSFIIFGVIICFASTIIAIVKSHYSYDDKAAKGPMQYVYTAGKAILNMAVAPIVIVLGLYVSQAILTAIDSITSTTSSNVVSLYGDAVDLLVSTDTSKTATGLENSTTDSTYIYYDIFGFGGAIVYSTTEGADSAAPTKEELALVGASNQTFSGSLFRLAGYNANRVRSSMDMNISGFYEGELFYRATTIANPNNEDKKGSIEMAADMIDTAFACNLHLKQSMELKVGVGGWSSTQYFTNFFVHSISAFSKFNVGAVWYYYDLWTFNYIIGFAACIVCGTVFINIILGLIARLIMCIGLFLVAPPLFGLAPLDDGKAGASWRENFMKQVLMAYGAVIGMNLFFLILPYLNQIDFFNIAIADYLAQTLVIIVGLITIKAFIATASGLVKGADANESGSKIAEDVGSVAGKALKMTVGAATAAVKLPVNAYRGAKAVKNKVDEARRGEGIGISVTNPFTGNKHFIGVRGEERRARENLQNIDKYQRQRDALQRLNGQNAGSVNRDDFIANYIQNGGTRKEANELWRTVRSEQRRVGAGGTLNARDLRNNFAGGNEQFANMEANYRGLAGGRRLQADTRTYERQRNVAATLRNDAHTRYVRNRSGLTGLRDMVFSPFSNFNDVAGENKFYSTFKDKSFWRKPDYQRETAENTRSIRDNVISGRADLRQGIETVNDNVQIGNNESQAAYRARVRMLTQEFVATHGRNPNTRERRMINNRARAGATHL